MGEYADLHLHSLYSDGSYSPEEVVERAKNLGYKAIALTDHDTVDGIPRFLKAGKERGIEVIPGVEISAEMNEEIHILGLFIEWENPPFIKRLRELVLSRQERVKRILKKLSKLGISITWEEVRKVTQGEVVGRLHIARVLKEKGVVKSITEAFTQYLGEGAPAYVSRKRVSPQEAVELITSVKGIPILAHPQFLKDLSIIPSLVEAGIAGIEVYFPNHGENPSPRFLSIAREYNLLLSGGSDCHGKAKEEILLGKVKVPYPLVEKMREWRRKRYGS